MTTKFRQFISKRADRLTSVSFFIVLFFESILINGKWHKDDMIFDFLNKTFAWFSCPADKVDSLAKFIGVPTDD